MHAPLHDLTLSLTLRPFQARALQVMQQRVGDGARRLHVVAPPGSGKTILGLAWIADRDQRAVVVSPTSTIAAQWVRAAQDHLAAPLADAAPDPDALAHGDHRADALPHILCTTYQAVSVKDRTGDTDCDADLHDNVHALFERFAEAGVRTVVLDECHHLLNHWARAIAVWMDRTPDALLLGLTATPPVDSSARERALHHDLLGPVTVEIPLPAMVRSGHLAPWQDLALLVQPTAREHAWMAGAHARFADLARTLDDPPEPLLSLRFWIQHRLEALAEGATDVGSWAEALLDAPDLLIALVRVADERGVPLPAGAWRIDEMSDPPDLADEARVLDDYARGYLRALRDGDNDPFVEAPATDDARRAADALWADMRDALAPVGYRLTRRGVQRRASELDRLLGLSAAKYDALGQILTTEQATLLDELRAVVVVDFERATSRRTLEKLDGVLDPGAGGAVSVVRYLAAHDGLDDLDAVMVSGSNLVCDPDIAETIVDALAREAAMQGWSIETRVEHRDGLCRIVGRGADWRSSHYTLLVTRLFEQGVFRCIVGTRGLLGEGWNTRTANVLVDLTSVSAFVSTNQVRGRCLRIDPDRPDKVSNLWDVVAIAPTLDRGFADFDRFVRKHGHVFGVADDGAIEQGVGHVHPAFSHVAPQHLAARIPTVNADMLARAGDRDAARDAWAIGADWADETVSSVEVRVDPGTLPVPEVASAERGPDAPFDDVALPPGLAQSRARRWARAVAERDAAVDDAHRHRDEARAAAQTLRDEATAIEADAQRDHDTALVFVSAEQARADRFRRAWVTQFAPGAVAGAVAAAFAGASFAWPVLLVVIAVASLAGAQTTHARQSAVLRDEASAAAVTAQRHHASAAALRARADGIEAQADDVTRTREHDADTRLATARTVVEAPVDDAGAARFYGEVLLDAFRRWDATRAEASTGAVRVTRRVDGALALELRGVSAAFTATWTRAWRELCGPLANPRYVLHCPTAGLAASVARAIDGVDATTVDGGAVLAVPDPLASHRAGADAMAAAWRAAAGPCRVLYTRRGEGAELLARNLSRRPWDVRSMRRTVWR